jgi:hypothetical protein
MLFEMTDSKIMCLEKIGSPLENLKFYIRVQRQISGFPLMKIEMESDKFQMEKNRFSNGEHVFWATG